MQGRYAAIKLRQLQYFVVVAETLHFTRAAERLAVTQPTLSHQIAELENRVGAQLFDRVGRSVRLTEAGVLFRTYATRCLLQLEAGRTALGELEGLRRGTLRIGVIQSFSRTLLPPLLGEFMSSYPNVQLRVNEMTAKGIEDAIAAGQLDVGIGFAPAVNEDTELEPVLEEKLLLVVGADHELASRRSVPMAALVDQRFALLSRDFSTRRLIDMFLERAGVHAIVACETNSIEIMFGAVRRTGLVTILPERAISEKRNGIRLVSLHDPAPVRTCALLWPRDAFRTVAARTFGQLVRDRLQSGSGRPSSTELVERDAGATKVRHAIPLSSK